MAVDRICGRRRGKREECTRFSLGVANEQAGRDEAAEPVSRDQILRRERDRENYFVSLFT